MEPHWRLFSIGNLLAILVNRVPGKVAQSEASPGAGYSIDVKDGMTIVVRTKKYVRDQTLIVYVDDISNVNYYSFRSGVQFHAKSSQ